MSDKALGYAANRRKDREVVRVVAELPQQLVEDIDCWGISAGMTSRREAAETLLRKGLEAAAHGPS